MKKSVFMAIISLAFAGQLFAQTSKQVKTKKMDNTRQIAEYTFRLSDNVTRQKVSFKNRYGIVLTGDLYLPKNRTGEQVAALAISGPFGAVKEQSSGLYAQNMAERGFAALAFDPSYTGESGGEPRNVASPDINTEDFSAAIDYLGLQAFADRNRIGVIGICGWAGMALNATAVDKRIKAVATTSMYDMSRVMAKGYFDKLTTEERTNFNYYKTERGFHPRSINSNGAWTSTNALSFMNMPLLTYIKEIAPRPILLIAGENAHSRYFSEDAFKAAAEPKELMIIPNARHVSLYDQSNTIPFDKLTEFFKNNLK